MTITLTENENTFISLEDAESYLETRLNIANWTNATEEDKKKALIQATLKIDNAFPFVGFKQNNEQALQFPRYKYYRLDRVRPSIIDQVNGNYEDIGTPKEIKYAVCEEALALLELSSSVHFTNQKMGINSISLNGSSVSYNSNPQKLISTEALNYVQKWVKTVGKIV